MYNVCYNIIVCTIWKMMCIRWWWLLLLLYICRRDGQEWFILYPIEEFDPISNAAKAHCWIRCLLFFFVSYFVVATRSPHVNINCYFSEPMTLQFVFDFELFNQINNIRIPTFSLAANHRCGLNWNHCCSLRCSLSSIPQLVGNVYTRCSVVCTMIKAANTQIVLKWVQYFK